jgi:DNA polymerase-3 subunit delta
MAVEKIISDLKKGNYKPVYWLEGDEEYFIDKVVSFAEHRILHEAEASFNLSVFYGKDAEWTDVLNACRRYPMFSEKQVIIIKEAQTMRNIEKLEAYVDKPLSSTILFVAFKNKKVDGRTKLARLLKDKGVLLTTKKLYDNELPEWTQNLVQSRGFTITRKALYLLIDHIGNDLNRLSNEIDKISVNLSDRKSITEDDIEAFVGVSKEFNVFELQHAIAQRDMYKSTRIIQYFEANPKAAPLQLLLPSLYSFFSKVLMVYLNSAGGEKAVAAAIGVNSYFLKDYMQAAQNYSYSGVEKILLLLHHYNLRSIGIDDAGTSDAMLMKEMVAKMIME